MIRGIDSLLLGQKPWGLYTCEAVTVTYILPYVRNVTIVHNYHEKGSAPPYLDGSTCWTNASSTFTTAISQIPVMWPTSHVRHYSSMEYFQEPAPVTTENSDKDSPMRDRSPSPAAPAVLLIQLEAHEQLSPP